MVAQTRSQSKKAIALEYDNIIQNYIDARKCVVAQHSICINIRSYGKNLIDSVALKKYTNAVAAFKEARTALRMHPGYDKKRSAAATVLLTEMEDTDMDVPLLSTPLYMAMIKEQTRRLISPEGFELISAPDGDGALARKNTMNRIRRYQEKHPTDATFAENSAKVRGMFYAIELMESAAT